MEFLVACCKLILHDLSKSRPLADSKIPVQETLPLVTTDVSEHPTTLARAIERQHRTPTIFDYKRMQDIVNAKRAETEDRIWSLRGDPSSFADTITDWNEHRREMLIDTSGHDHPVGPKRSQNHALFWERVCFRDRRYLLIAHHLECHRATTFCSRKPTREGEAVGKSLRVACWND